VFGDSAYRSNEIGERLRAGGFKSRIHLRATRERSLSQAQANANHNRSKIRARVEHVFAAQQTALGGRIVRTIGIVRARAKIGLQNLAYPPPCDAGADRRRIRVESTSGKDAQAEKRHHAGGKSHATNYRSTLVAITRRIGIVRGALTTIGRLQCRRITTCQFDGFR